MSTERATEINQERAQSKKKEHRANDKSIEKKREHRANEKSIEKIGAKCNFRTSQCEIESTRHVG